MTFWFILLIWAGLTILTIRRLQVTLANLRLCVGWRSVRLAGREIIGWPVIQTLRPLRHLAVWFAELLVLMFCYELFGVAVVAHIAAAVVTCAVVIILRDRQESNPLRALQLMPMARAEKTLA